MSKQKKFWIFIGILAFFAPVLVVAWHFRLVALAQHWIGASLRAEAWRHHSLQLSAYRVTLEAHPISGLTRNLSSLTYNTRTDTLFATINHPPQVVEITREGHLLRQIPVTGIDDLEGISHVEENRFILIDERKQRVYWDVPIAPETQSIDVSRLPRLELGLLLNENFGFEGITWNHHTRQLFVAKEKPPRIFVIHNPAQPERGDTFDLNIRDWSKPAAFMRDISSLSLNDKNGHMLILSDESKLLVEYSKEGELLGLLPLWIGWHGLKRSIPQAEGATVAPDGTIYIVSEPNLFYRFERPHT
ncbi:MAG: SdiA-regulated domain-containing protein [Zoogloeaceae bacterium]|jgi:uncharacterized protein YjiK|nr:SdiA-regulated domain-containing protein [Zoogloeaceae bacterium]